MRPADHRARGRACCGRVGPAAARSVHGTLTICGYVRRDEGREVMQGDGQPPQRHPDPVWSADPNGTRPGTQPGGRWEGPRQAAPRREPPDRASWPGDGREMPPRGRTDRSVNGGRPPWEGAVAWEGPGRRDGGERRDGPERRDAGGRWEGPEHWNGGERSADGPDRRDRQGVGVLDTATAEHGSVPSPAGRPGDRK